MDILTDFARGRIPEITATAGLVTYSITRNKLTIDGIMAGILVAVIHMAHPWPAFFWLLMLFFLFGTAVTKIGHAQKAHLTQSATGGGGGEGARTSAQVFANSGWACVLILAHTVALNSSPFISSHVPITGFVGPYAPVLQRILPLGIIIQYAAVAADTFSSELGILSAQTPFLITRPWVSVPKGTNGGVTRDGLRFGGIGSFLLVLTAMLVLRVAPPYATVSVRTASFLTLMGLLGSVIDSVLGAAVQATVTDKGTGKVVEGPGGRRVSVVKGGSRVQMGKDWLTNNGVNFVMAASTSLLGMILAWALKL